MSLLDFRFANSVRSLFTNPSYTIQDFYNVIKETESDYKEVNDQVTFIDNHDMSRFSTIVNGNRTAVNQAYALLLTSRGVPTIYYGSEQYDKGESAPYNRSDITSFNQTTDAYQIISKLSKLRKSNKALAYGQTVERWINQDVLIFERHFGNSVAIVAVNKGDKSYHIDNLKPHLPKGDYVDKLASMMAAGNIQVRSDNSVTPFELKAGSVGVWTYDNSQTTKLSVGDIDPSIGSVGNEIAITGEGFGNKEGQVKFGDTNAKVLSWSDTLIKVLIPEVAAGKYAIHVSNLRGEKGTYSDFEVLTGKQIPVRLIADNAQTLPGENLYVVGNVSELGNWDANKAIGPMFNATASIAQYPSWFYDINLPKNKNIEYKFIKKNKDGQIIWESGENHKITSSEEAQTKRASWQN